ncbi:MAG: hypothetical protein ACKV2O_09145 [Acidimicrobiales bacterium]
MLMSLVVLLSVVVALLTVLVVGLLRSYGEVLRRLHAAGIGAAGSDGADMAAAAPAKTATAATTAPAATTRSASRGGPDPEAADIARRLDPAVPAPRQDGAVLPEIVDVSGVTPAGDAIAVGLRRSEQATMLAFLSSGCTTCSGFWEPLRNGERLTIGNRDVRIVVVTAGSANERPAAVAALAGPDLTVVMSEQAWSHYAVPATPYFVLMDATLGILGEGSALTWTQLVGLMERAVTDRGFNLETAPRRPSAAGRRRRGAADVVDLRGGPEREVRADDALRAAGIVPGDTRLYESPFDAPLDGPLDAELESPEPAGTVPSAERSR